MKKNRIIPNVPKEERSQLNEGVSRKPKSDKRLKKIILDVFDDKLRLTCTPVGKEDFINELAKRINNLC